MVKRVNVLEAEINAEADVPYERTRLARQAPRSRRRLASLLLVGSLVMLLEAAVHQSGGWLLGSFALGATAWGMRKGRLGALIAAGLAATLALLLPVRWFFLMRPDEASVLLGLGVSVVLGAAALPDLVRLIRDAELQHAYGLWARRDEAE